MASASSIPLPTLPTAVPIVGGGNYSNAVLNSAGLPTTYSTPDNALNEQAREFNITAEGRNNILALLQAAVQSASGVDSQLGGVSPSSVTAIQAGGPNASPYSPTAADEASATAAFTQAKQNTADSLNASLQGLRNAMQARGITGSGIEGQGTSSLYASGLEDLSNEGSTEANTLAQEAYGANQQTASLNEQAREANQSAAINTGEFNASQAQQAGEFNVTTAANKLNTLVNAYKGIY